MARGYSAYVRTATAHLPAYDAQARLGAGCRHLDPAVSQGRSLPQNSTASCALQLLHLLLPPTASEATKVSCLHPGRIEAAGRRPLPIRSASNGLCQGITRPCWTRRSCLGSLEGRWEPKQDLCVPDAWAVAASGVSARRMTARCLAGVRCASRSRCGRIGDSHRSRPIEA